MNKKGIETMIKGVNVQIKFYEEKLKEDKYNINYQMIIEYYKGARDMAQCMLENK